MEYNRVSLQYNKRKYLVLPKPAIDLAKRKDIKKLNFHACLAKW